MLAEMRHEVAGEYFNMTMGIRAIAPVLAVICPAAAIADDTAVAGALAPFKQPVEQPASDFDWTGFSVGLELGYVPDAEGADGPIYGAKLAYDHDFGDFILGGFLQYGRLELDIDDGFELVSYSRIGARGGIDSGLNWFYASAGYTELDTHAPGNANPGGGNGYFVGLGYERFVREKLTLGAEVVYSDFNDFFREFRDIDITTLAVSLNYRF